MSTRFDSWLAARVMETPDVFDDVATYFAGIDKGAFDALPQSVQLKLTVLVERLEFVGHLKHAALRIGASETACLSHSQPSDGRDCIRATLTNEIDGHDFAGFGSDVDALCVYMLLTCVDTIMGQPQYVSPFEWLAIQPQPWDLRKLREDYGAAHGLSQRFRAAFTDRCGASMRAKLLDRLAVVKLSAAGVTPVSAEAFEARDDDAKLRRIAATLYEMRSGFTHASARTFSPSVPIRVSHERGGSMLILKPGPQSLTDMLQEFVVDLARVELLENGAAAV